MSEFDQRDQQVHGPQFNAAGDIHVHAQSMPTAPLARLRQSFESLAIRSKGLYHVLEEQEQRIGIEQEADDGTPPCVLLRGIPSDPRSVLAFSCPPGVPFHPRELTSEEQAAAREVSDGQKYIRDGHGRALAKWIPSIVRMGYITGDPEVGQPFGHLAEAAGTAIIEFPDDLVGKLPPLIQTSFRPRKTLPKRVIFGSVPQQPSQFLAQGWKAGLLVFDEGVIVDYMEPGTSSSRSDSWLLLLHQLGWEAKSGDLLRASRWFWRGNRSVDYSSSDFSTDDAIISSMLADIPRHRFYSMLGAKGRQTDVCWASVWAIDQLLMLNAQA